MTSFALLDVVSPYVLGGAAIGDPLHELLSALFVQYVETSFDDNGVVVSGMARFSAEINANPPRYTPPAGFTFSATATVDHRTARHAGAFWDFPDIAIRFRLTAPRASSPVADLVISGGPSANPPPLANAGVRNVLIGLAQGQPAVGAPAADAPNTAFHLDLLFDAATLHLPFLTAAKLGADGMLTPDQSQAEVTVTLPKIKLSFEQTAGATVPPVADPQMSVTLDSWAAHDIDDPAGTAYAELIQMKPPYALIGPGDTLGFGFQSVVLDLSGTETPPELLAKSGVGDDFRGIYLPDVRVFLKVPGLRGLSFDVSARELLIGLGPEGGVSGIFGVDIVLPDAPQSATIMVYDEFGQLITRLVTPEIADPTQPAAPWNAPPVHVPAKTQWIVDVTGGQPPYNISIDGNVQTTDPVTITLPAGTTSKDVAIEISDVHVGGQSRSITVPVVLTARSLAAGTVVQGAAQPAQISSVAAGPLGYTITMLDTPGAEKITLIFTPPNPGTATLTGASGPTTITVTGGRATIDLKHGEQCDVAAIWNVAAVPAATPLTLTGQFQYDQPQAVPNKTPQDPNDPAWAAFAADPSNIRTIASQDAADPLGGWTAPDSFLLGSGVLAAFVAEAKKDASQAITLEGMASKEHIPNQQYNVDLSLRRIWAMQRLLSGQGVNNPMPVPVPAGEQPPADPYLEPGRGAYRRVESTLLTGGAPASTANATVHLSRPARPATPVPVKPKISKREPVGNDSIRFKEAHLRVEIDHNRLIAVEARLKVDVETVLESYLSRVKQDNPGQVPVEGQGSTKLPVGKADANDGVLDIRVQLTLDDTVDRWQVVASLFENDKDGFLQTPPPSASDLGSSAEQYWRDFFGVMIALTPLIDATASSNTPAGDLASLAVAVGVPFAAVKLDIVHVPRITLYGGEFTMTHDTSGVRGVLLLDVEVALVVVLEIKSTKLIDTKPDNPITVRYKAIGFRTSDQPQIRDLVPVFDSSKGYTINVPSTGGIKVPDPLGDILQIAGTRIARSNPLNLELDIELKADLGVVSVDRTTIRIPLEGGHAPTISALGVHIDIPGAIEGHGYLAIYEDGFAGQMDVSLPGIGLRVAAGLSVRHVSDPANPSRTATAVLLTMEVDFPVPIALGSSGFGIYGFGGLFALHFKRDEHAGDPMPALDWLQRVNGNPMDITGWVPQIDDWAIGLGALLGTMDSGFTLNVKGMMIFEMPGPRILLVMKANLIKARPQRPGNVTAPILAVIDIDLGRGRISIGLTFDYAVDPLLRIHIPVRAIFPFSDLAHFAIDAGTWYNPATVEFFKLFTAHGYFMIRGKGIPDAPGTESYDGGKDPPSFSPLGGFAIATGVSVSFLWGSKSSGLYLSVGASVDVGLGFSPIMFTGTLRLWGELHLWIIGIEASAQLSVKAGQVPIGPPQPDPDHPGKTYQPTKSLVLIDGEVHGQIDLFFFTIEGSVHVTLGDEPGSPPEPPKLVVGVSLQSRAPALLNGINSDRPIDGKLTDAHQDGSDIPASEAVPIDAIIVLHLDCIPRINAGATFSTSQDGTPVAVAIQTPGGPAAPAVRRGDPYYTYRITGVTLDNGLTKGEVPIVWWPGQPNPDSESKRELALLTRVPDPHPCAVERSMHQEDVLAQTWSTVCDEVAPPTSVLWTFHDSPLGSSSIGWVLFGTAWPDPPGSHRNSPPNLRLDVAETWRSGKLAIDLLIDIAPARVVGGVVPCDGDCQGQRQASRRTAKPPADQRLVELAAGVSKTRMPVVRPQPEIHARFEPAATTGRCPARALEAPFLRDHNYNALATHPLGIVLTNLAKTADDRRKDHLDDVVAFSTKEIVHARLLLLVPQLILKRKAKILRFLKRRAMILRCFAADGTILDDITIDGGGGPSKIVHTSADLPVTWRDKKGPWFCPVSEAVAYLNGVRGQRKDQFELILVDTKVKPGTAYLQIGLLDVEELIANGLGRPSYLVGVVETQAAAEVERYHTESTIKSHKVETLNGALKGLHDPPALLLPSSTYTVHVDYEWATCDKDGSAVGAWTAESQDFQFRTDNQPLAPNTVVPPDGDTPSAPGSYAPGSPRPATMPVRLDPWVMLTDPDEGEHFYFYGKPIRVVFSVDYLLDMFGTYGVPLQARVRAASFANSSPSSPNFSKTVKALSSADAKLIPSAFVFTPWEDSIRDIIKDAPCIDSGGDISRQTVLDLDLVLEPRTDYVFDIEPVDAPVPPVDSSVTPLFRRSFTTSRYQDATAMCAAVKGARAHEFRAAAADVTDLEALVSAPGPMSGAALDAALRKAGLRPVLEVTDPEIEVLWVLGAGGLQPRIFVIRTPEPLVRTRREPEEYEPPGQPRLQRKIIRLVDKPYLEVVQTPGVPGAPVMHIVSQPALNTVIVVVDAGRDTPIDLSLRRHDNAFLGEGSGVADVSLLEMRLDAATWEVAS